MLPLFERRDSPWKFSRVNPYFGDIELQSSMRNASPDFMLNFSFLLRFLSCYCFSIIAAQALMHG